MKEKPKDLWTDDEFIAHHGVRAESAAGRPVYLGRLKRPGWSGSIRTYLVWCRRCRYTPTRGFSVAHLAGHKGRLECSYCRERFDHLPRVGDVRDVLMNPHKHPWFLCFILLVALLLGIYASQP